MSGGHVAMKHLSLARIEALLCGGKGLLLPRHGALILARRRLSLAGCLFALGCGLLPRSK